MATLLFPGRHILNTRFQEEYLLASLQRPVEALPLLPPSGPGAQRPSGVLDQVVFAVTSANQCHSRYNPVPIEVRAVGVDRFARRLKDCLSVRYRIVPIPHYRPSPRFAGYILKEIDEASEGRLELTPADTVVLSSTPDVIEQYLALGFCVLPGELESLDARRYAAATPSEVLRRVVEAGDPGWAQDEQVRRLLSPPTFGCWQDFPDVPRRIVRLFRDPLLTEHGGLTDTRNYSTYARRMGGEAVVALKYNDFKHFIAGGKIADEGCADGALLVPVARDFPDSDLVGIEITGEFLARCVERQRAMEFGGTYVHFHQRNITEPVFEPDSIDTTLCNSTTHELWSYGDGETTVRAYLKEKFRQTAKGGRLIIRDVVGPGDKERDVWMWCNDADGSNGPAAEASVEGLSTAARFRRFAAEFLAAMRASGRRGPGTQVRFREETLDGRRYFVLRLRDAAEFMLKKDYADNWASELNEEFCFWDFEQWKAALREAGFAVVEDPNELVKGSRAYANEWIVRNRFVGKVELFGKSGLGSLERVPYPATNMVLVGEKR